MQTVLLGLRTIIGSGVALVVWFAITTISAAPTSLLAVIAPVWLAGISGGVVCAMFNLRQAIGLAFTCGVMLSFGFLWFRHGITGIGLGENTFMTLWPMWFPPAFYVGAHGYVVVLAKLSRK